MAEIVNTVAMELIMGNGEDVLCGADVGTIEVRPLLDASADEPQDGGWMPAAE